MTSRPRPDRRGNASACPPFGYVMSFADPRRRRLWALLRLRRTRASLTRFMRRLPSREVSARREDRP